MKISKSAVFQRKQFAPKSWHAHKNISSLQNDVVFAYWGEYFFHLKLKIYWTEADLLLNDAYCFILLTQEESWFQNNVHRY